MISDMIEMLKEEQKALEVMVHNSNHEHIVEFLKRAKENVDKAIYELGRAAFYDIHETENEIPPIYLAKDLELTQDQMDHWKQNGGCPRCGSQNIEYGEKQYEDTWWQHVQCPECGLKWREVYQMVLIEADVK